MVPVQNQRRELLPDLPVGSQAWKALISDHYARLSICRFEICLHAKEVDLCVIFGKSSTALKEVTMKAFRCLEDAMKIPLYRVGSGSHISDLIDPALYLPPKSFNWLPTVVKPTSRGWEFSSPILNVDEYTFPELRCAIQNVFQSLIFPAFQGLLPFHLLHKRKQLQVVIKAQNYDLHSTDDSFESVFHKEGLSSDAILAVGIYYYEKSKELQGGNLEVKVRVPWDSLFDKPITNLVEALESYWNQLHENTAEEGLLGESSSAKKEEIEEVDQEDCGSQGTSQKRKKEPLPAMSVPVEDGSFVVFRNDYLYHHMTKITCDQRHQFQRRKHTHRSKSESSVKNRTRKSNNKRSAAQRQKYPQHDQNKPMRFFPHSINPMDFPLQRKILAFFLVDPDHPISDTESIEVNQRFLIVHLLSPYLPGLILKEIIEYYFNPFDQVRAARQTFKQRRDMTILQESEWEEYDLPRED
jgi:hypothetical protein